MTTDTDSSVTRAREVLATAHDALVSAARGVADDDWSAPTPCAEWTVTQVFQHAVGDQQAYVRELTGSGGPTEDPFAPSGAIDGDPVGFVEQAVAAARASWAAQERDAVPTPLPQGNLPLTVAIGAPALDAVVHAWGVYAAARDEGPDAADHLLGYLGRDPHWTN